MDTKKYEVLEKTVQLGSLTRAAEELGLTQSGVSHIIASLEEELGLPVLRRTRTGAHLTDAGEKLMPWVRQILQAEEQLKWTAESIRGAAEGTVSIGTFTSVAVHWLPGMMKEFQLEYPKVEFRLLNGDYADVDGWLAQGAVDVGFVALPAPAGCECVPLAEDPLLAVLPKGHPLAALESCPVRAVAAEPFISLLEASNHDARRALEAVGVKPNVRFTTKDDYAMIAMVEQGLGVSIMPELLLRGRDEGVVTRPLDPPASRVVALAIPTAAHVGPAARRFAEFAAVWVRAHGQNPSGAANAKMNS